MKTNDLQTEDGTPPGLTLITGSSSGIGLALARECAGHGHPLILVAPVKAEIEKVASEIAAEFGKPRRTPRSHS